MSGSFEPSFRSSRPPLRPSRGVGPPARLAQMSRNARVDPPDLAAMTALISLVRADTIDPRPTSVPEVEALGFLRPRRLRSRPDR